MEKEIWKVYKDTSNRSNGHLWEVSTSGDVKIDGIIEVPVLFNGYYKVRNNFVHRMVAITYINNLHNKPCVDHIDGNKLNNNVNNLRWVSYSENMNNPKTKRVHNSEVHNTKISNSLHGKVSPTKNKHRVYDNEEHTKWHMVSNN